jgi:hypothetical protein
MACWRDTWFPGNGMVLSEVRPIVAVLLTSRSKGSPPAELTRNFAGISSRYDGMPVVRLPAAMSGPLPTRPALFSTAGAGLSSGRSYKNNLTSHAQPPRVANIPSRVAEGLALRCHGNRFRESGTTRCQFQVRSIFEQRWRVRRSWSSRDSWWGMNQNICAP